MISDPLYLDGLGDGIYVGQADTKGGMSMRRLRRIWILLAGCLVVAAALFFGTAAGAHAEYGPGAVYQVEISANALPGPSFWFWAELDPGGTSGDYQMTDCIHVGRGGPNAAAHASGSVESWSVGGGMLTMTGVKIIGGEETATISAALPSSGAMYGHSNAVTVTVTSAIGRSFPSERSLASVDTRRRCSSLRRYSQTRNGVGSQRNRASRPRNGSPFWFDF